MAKGIPDGQTIPLYNSIDVAEASPGSVVLVVEGEKTANFAYRATGRLAVTWMGGSGGVKKPHDWESLAGLNVIVCPDNDDPGRKAAKVVCGRLLGAGVASLSVLNPPPDSPEGWDLADMKDLSRDSFEEMLGSSLLASINAEEDLQSAFPSTASTTQLAFPSIGEPPPEDVLTNDTVKHWAALNVFAKGSDFFIRRPDSTDFETNPVTKKMVISYFVARGIRREFAENALAWTGIHNQVDYAGPIAGWAAGHYGRLLCTQTPQMKKGEPREGIDPQDPSLKAHAPFIASFLRGLLVDPLTPDNEDQVFTALAWLKQARIDLRKSLAIKDQKDRVKGQSQALVFAGPPGCGKSLLLNQILNPSLTGRKVCPVKAWSGKDKFNYEVSTAELLAADDKLGDMSRQSRVAVGAEAKSALVGESTSVTKKYANTIDLKTYVRLVLCCNVEGESLQVLPPLTADIRDKIHLLLTYAAPIPSPEFVKGNEEDDPSAKRELISSLIHQDLPHFLHFVDEVFETPEHLKEPKGFRRFGIKAQHHPEIVARLNQLEPSFQLLTALCEAIRNDPSNVGFAQKEGTAQELITYCVHWTRDAGKAMIQRLISSPVHAGRLLSQLAEDPTIPNVRKLGQDSAGTAQYIVELEE